MKAKRAYLTPKERADMERHQGYACFTFGCVGKPKIGEHFTPVAMGNDQKPDCLLCIDCARDKTRRDVKNIAKVKRIRKRADGTRKPRKKIASPGFDKTKTKKLGTGKVVERKR